MKRFIPLLISLIALASCTGMLDDMQSQIDDLDSRVTALEKDSKLISENLSTVKKDLEVGLSSITNLRKDTDEIADTLYACKLRMQNDLDVSMKLVQTAMYDVDHLDRNSSELAQSIVDAYAAIDVALKLGNQNASKLSSLESQCSSLTSFSSKLSSFETLLNDLCANSVYSKSVANTPTGVIFVEKNKSGYVLRQVTKTEGSVTERLYTPGKRSYQEYYEYDGGYYVRDVYPNGNVFWIDTWVRYIDWVNEVIYGGGSYMQAPNAVCTTYRVVTSAGVDIQKCVYTEAGSTNEYDMSKLNKYYFPESELSATIYIPLFSIFHNSSSSNGGQISFFKEKNSHNCILRRWYSSGSYVDQFVGYCGSANYSKLMKFVSDLYDSKQVGQSSYSWSDFELDWNAFVDSSDFINKSFKF